jgi:hypothetical protein
MKRESDRAANEFAQLQTREQPPVASSMHYLARKGELGRLIQALVISED